MNPYRIAEWIVKIWPAWLMLGLGQWAVNDRGAPWWTMLAFLAGVVVFLVLVIGGLLLHAWLEDRADAWRDAHRVP